MKNSNLIKNIFVLIICLLSFKIPFCQSLNVKNKIVSINGYFGGKIPYSKIKNVKQKYIVAPYKFVSATIYFSSGVGTGCTQNSSLLKSTKFTKDFLQLWNRLAVGSVISFENIKLEKPDGSVAEVVSTSFIIVENIN